MRIGRWHVTVAPHWRSWRRVAWRRDGRLTPWPWREIRLPGFSIIIGSAEPRDEPTYRADYGGWY